MTSRNGKFAVPMEKPFWIGEILTILDSVYEIAVLWTEIPGSNSLNILHLRPVKVKEFESPEEAMFYICKMRSL